MTVSPEEGGLSPERSAASPSAPASRDATAAEGSRSAMTHRAFQDVVIAALNGPDDEVVVRALASPQAWDTGGLRGLWKLRRDGVRFSSAGVLSERGPRTLGCVRYERDDVSKPARSAFVLLAEVDSGFRIEGVYEEIPLALAWLRGWIEPGVRAEALPSDEGIAAFAQRIAEVAHGQLGAFLIEHCDAETAMAARADTMLPAGAAKVIGVHVLAAVGRALVGIGVGPMAMWLVLERRVESVERLRCVAVTVRPSMTALLTGARAYQPETERIEADLFMQRLLDAVRGRGTPATPELLDQRERFRQELVERLNASFTANIPADEAILSALRQTLEKQPARGRSVGELVAAVLGRIVQQRPPE